VAAVFESISGDFAVASLLIELFGVIEHLGSGNTGAAEAACRRIVADLPQQASALHQQGRDLFQSGRFAQGCELLRQAVACHPEVIGFHKTLAEALEMQGRRMEAQAVRADMPAVRPFQSQLSPILELLQSGRLAEAELICRRVLDSLPFHCRAYGLNELGLRGGARGALGTGCCISKNRLWPFILKSQSFMRTWRLRWIYKGRSWKRKLFESP
jgi:tetratricopeptide (TPR) repeat protein